MSISRLLSSKAIAPPAGALLDSKPPRLASPHPHPAGFCRSWPWSSEKNRCVCVAGVHYCLRRSSGSFRDLISTGD
jgi:hypothetical protein